MSFDDAFILITAMLVVLLLAGGATIVSIILVRVLEWLKD